MITSVPSHDELYDALADERKFWAFWRRENRELGADDPGAIVAELRFDSSVLRRKWVMEEANQIRKKNRDLATLAVETQVSYHKIKGRKVDTFSLADLHLLVGEELKKEEQAREAEILYELQFAPEVWDQPALRAFLKAMVGRTDETHVAVLSHWIWQVKRKLNNWPVVNHLMLVFYGRQGSGKSEALKALLQKVNKITLRVPFDDVVESRTYNQLARHAVCCVDELAGLKKADISKLKGLITADTLDQRIFHSQNMRRVKQRCSFVGSSNLQLQELIQDATGMRRFFQIDCLDKADWAALNNEVNFDQIWNEVDENLDEGYLVGEVMERVRVLQGGLISRDSVSLFLSECEIRAPLPDEASRVVDRKGLFRKYLDWANEAGIRTPAARDQFGWVVDRNKIEKDGEGYRVAGDEVEG
jgi:hypothetical protein